MTYKVYFCKDCKDQEKNYTGRKLTGDVYCFHEYSRIKNITIKYNESRDIRKNEPTFEGI